MLTRLIVAPLAAQLAALLTVLLASTLSFPVAAQPYPHKPVRFVIAFSPGGPSDILTRLLGAKLADALGQPIVYENRPGAGGNIAAELVVRSTPDGHTLLMGNNSILATNAALYKNMGFDPAQDLAPVMLVAAQPNILVVHPSLPVRSVNELVAYAKTRPGELNYASSGSGAAAHLAAELFKSMTGVQLVHVPYKGAGPALVDVLAGQCQVMFATSASVQSHLQAGRLRPLALTTARRSPYFPELPTIAEAGVPGFEATTWHGVVVPARTPEPIVARLNMELNRILQSVEMRERLATLGAEVLGGTPQQFAEYIRSEIPKWTRVVQASGAKPD